MDFAERMRELAAKGATMSDVASAFGLDVSSLPSEWVMFVSNMIMFSYSQQNLLEDMNSKMDGMDAKMDGLSSAVKSLQDELRQRSGKNSGNSSRPPSSDGYAKPNADRKRSLREQSGRKPGAQKGHEGNGLKKVAADETVTHNHYPSGCMKCENFSACVSLMKCMTTGHVYETRTVVTDNEHKVYSIVCPKMKRMLSSVMPEGVKSSQQYGYGIKAAVIDIWATGITSIKRLADLAEERTGIRISEGTIAKTIADFAVSCDKALGSVRKYLMKSIVKGADETGMRTNGTLYWLHTVCNEKATYLYADKKRGFDAINSNGLLTGAEGILVHDCWSSYFRLDNLEHAICLQHIQRELRGAALREKGHEEYFRRIEDFLLNMKKLKNDAIERGEEALDADVLKNLRDEFTKLIDEGLETFKQPKRRSVLGLGKIPQGRTRSLLLRLRDNIDAVFCFVEHFDAWYTNNESERSFRVGKVRQSVSKCFRTPDGLKSFASIMSILDTAKKNGIGRMKMIKAVLNGTAESLLSPVLG